MNKPQLPDPNKHKNNIYIDSNGKYYYSQNKNGVYDWLKLKINIKKTPDDFNKQFPNYIKPKHNLSFFTSNINNLIKEFKNIGILFYILKWNKKSLYADHYSIIKESFEKYLSKYPNGVIYTSEYLLNKYSYDNCILLHHDISTNSINNVNKILTSYFPKKTNGLENIDDTISIYINEQNKLKPTKKHILFEVYLQYLKTQKNKLSNNDFTTIYTYITNKLNKNYIHDLRQTHNDTKGILLYYTIYIDKFTQFTNKLKNIIKNTLLLPKLKSIHITPNNNNESNLKLSISLPD